MSREKGFTLIEVLIALAILAIALVAVIKVMAQSVSMTDRVKSKTAAHLVAMNVLAKMQLGMVDIYGEDRLQGVSNMLGQVWQWHATQLKDKTGYYERVKITVSLLHSEKTVDSLTGFVRVVVKEAGEDEAWSRQDNLAR